MCYSNRVASSAWIKTTQTIQAMLVAVNNKSFVSDCVKIAQVFKHNFHFNSSLPLPTLALRFCVLYTYPSLPSFFIVWICQWIYYNVYGRNWMYRTWYNRPRRYETPLAGSRAICTATKAGLPQEIWHYTQQTFINLINNETIEHRSFDGHASLHQYNGPVGYIHITYVYDDEDDGGVQHLYGAIIISVSKTIQRRKLLQWS